MSTYCDFGSSCCPHPQANFFATATLFAYTYRNRKMNNIHTNSLTYYVRLSGKMAPLRYRTLVLNKWPECSGHYMENCSPQAALNESNRSRPVSNNVLYWVLLDCSCPSE